MPPARPFARPLLLASFLTLVISLLRLWGELSGWATNASGGRFLPLGITWLVFVCGAWFGRRLAADGHPPRAPRAWLWPLLALLTMLVVVGTGFAPLAKAEPNDATFALLRAVVLRGVVVAMIAAAAMFAVWPALARQMLVYGLLARGFVVVLTWLAKHMGWNTHYTKFGPMGLEREGMGETLFGAGLAQIGFWVPFTIVGGVLAGCIAIGRRPAAN
jgi:hypothetical protein